MKHICLSLFVLLFMALSALGQKKNISFSDLGSWPKILPGITLSNDGKTIAYSYSSPEREPVLVIQSLQKKWKKEYSGATGLEFSADNKTAYFLLDHKLMIFDINSDKISAIDHVSSFQIARHPNFDRLLYLCDNQKLVLEGKDQKANSIYDRVASYQFNQHGNILLLQLTDSLDKQLYYVTWVNLISGNIDTIHLCSRLVKDFVFDATGKRIAFIEEGADTKSKLMVFTEGNKISRTILNDEKIRKGLAISSFYKPIFTPDGTKIILALSKESTQNPLAEVNPKIVRYDDGSIIVSNSKSKKYRVLTAIDADRGRVTYLENEEDSSTFTIINETPKGNYVLAYNLTGNHEEGFWRESARAKFYLVSIKEGSRKLLEYNPEMYITNEISFSNAGKYVIWFDRTSNTYFTYNVFTGEKKNVTSTVSDSVGITGSSSNSPGLSPFGIAGWTENDNDVLIYSAFDIWKVDPDNLRKPVNLTKGYGKQNQIRLRYFATDFNQHIKETDPLLLVTGINGGPDRNSFYVIRNWNKDTPKLLSINTHGFSFVKKSKKGTVILNSASAADAPNLVATTDFKQFTTISDVNPQRECNWLTAQIINWKASDGREYFGYLYKPENFDPSKKYPVVFNFYAAAGPLYYFRYPEASNGDLNIPYFVSNGYLVFRPSITYETLKPGQSSANALISAAKYLSTFNWVDSARIGLVGISWGAYQINYLVTQTNLFAAAAPSAGMTDLVSDYNGLWWDESKQWVYEIAQGRMWNKTLWQGPQAYIDNSPVLFADKVQTPLLIMHNKEDEAVNWMQGIEWFTALRRLEKPAWMVSYAGEKHGLAKMDNQLDYTKRLEQFLNHFLKGFPAPKWMTTNLPEMRSLKDAYTLDPLGNCSKDCKVCKMWNQKMTAERK